MDYSPRQSQARLILAEPGVDELTYGGAKGGGKSVFGCQWLFEECYNIGKAFFPHEPPTEPIQAAWMGRKVAQDFRTTTLETWRRYIPKEYYEIRGKPEEIIVYGRIKIVTGGLDNREDIEKFNSMRLARGFLDQAEETTQEEVGALRGAFLFDIHGKPIRGKMLFTCNPRQGWVKNEFILNPKPNQRFLQALYTDNPFIDQADYERRLDTAFGFRPELLLAYKKGDWNAVENPEQIIKSDWLMKAKTRNMVPLNKKMYLVCDTARFGDDTTVILLMFNTEIVKLVVMPYCDATQIVAMLAQMSVENGNCPIVVETVGADLGSAVADFLRKQNRRVIEFSPASAARDSEHYGNLRAEAWNNAARKLSSGVIDQFANTPLVTNNLDEQMISQLCTPTYKWRGEKLYVEEKAEIKKRLGCSPDKADTYVMALWAFPLIPYEKSENIQGYLDISPCKTNIAESYKVKSSF